MSSNIWVDGWSGSGVTTCDRAGSSIYSKCTSSLKWTYLRCYLELRAQKKVCETGFVTLWFPQTFWLHSATSVVANNEETYSNYEKFRIFQNLKSFHVGIIARYLIRNGQPRFFGLTVRLWTCFETEITIISTWNNMTILKNSELIIIRVGFFIITYNRGCRV